MVRGNPCVSGLERGSIRRRGTIRERGTIGEGGVLRELLSEKKGYKYFSIIN
jgi:hypothetical protein